MKISKKALTIFVLLVLVVFFLVILRLFINGGEDTWICDQGQWVKHGQPSHPAPTGSCR